MSTRIERAIAELNAALAEAYDQTAVQCGCRSAGHEVCGSTFEPPNPESEGLTDKFVVLKATGEPTKPEARYFVLRYDKQDDWCSAARKALLVFAEEVDRIGFHELADDLVDAMEHHDKGHWTSQCD